MPTAHRSTPKATDSWFDQLAQHDPLPRPAPAPAAANDQAAGLRRLFTGHTLRCIPVVSHPTLAFSGALLERLCTAYGEMDLRTLVVDAGERARAPKELASFDLAEGVEMLSPRLSFLAARGLALRYVDATGSTSAFLDALGEAAPDTDVVLLHASASDLARLLARRVQELQAHAVRPIVLADEQPASITHAYGAIKLLAMRAGLMAHDLLISAEPSSSRAAMVAQRVERCADDFLGAALHSWVAIDPAESATDAPSAALQRLVREQLACALPQHSHDSAFGALAQIDTRRAALPAAPGARGGRRP